MSKASAILGGGDAAAGAAGAQSAAIGEAIDFQKQVYKQNSKNLAPFRELGARNLGGLEDLVTNPEAQLDFINNNPFFEALANRSKDTLLNNQAAKGKVGSGGTAEALQNSLLTLGTDLVNQNITQRSNLVNTGYNAIIQQGNFGNRTAQNLGSLYTDQGNANAAAIAGKQQGDLASIGNIANIGASILSLCDVRVKENIEHVGKLNNGMNLYSFNYIDDDKTHINVMAQEVEESMPEAIIEMDGLKHVNMEKLNVTKH